MKKAGMNISHSRFILFKLKIFGEILTTIFISFTLEQKGSRLRKVIEAQSLL